MTDRKFLAVFGAKIKKFRNEKKVTQVELAAKCNFEKAFLSRIESGKSNITLLTLKKIADALEKDIYKFFKE